MHPSVECIERYADVLNYQALINVALDQFAIPGDVSFPLNQAYEAPRDRQDAETLRACVSLHCLLRWAG